MSGASQKTSSSPHVLRIETLSLDPGELAVVIELEQAPSRSWVTALKRELGQSDGLEEATANCDGRFVYIVGLEPSLRGALQRVSRVLQAVQGGGAPPATRPVGGYALHA
ncbi:hypothetical protein ACIGHF_02575 [Stenotrophomonas sp. NPDC077464]|uniref:hypothetical protein n=1 Tax=unclassified Stenotrophomonas TaxID=196198 RepID=UPI0037D87275